MPYYIHSVRQSFHQSVDGMLLCVLCGSGLALQKTNKTIPEGAHGLLPPSVAWSVQEQNYFFCVAKLMEPMCLGLISFAGYILGRKASVYCSNS